MSCSIDEGALVACRVPYLPIQTVRAFLDSGDPYELLKSTWVDRADIRAAVLLSSPSLHSAAQRWSSGKKAKNKNAPLKLLMYLLRMSARCTPFGTFAGLGIVALGQETTLHIPPNPFSTVTKPDTGWLGAFVEGIEKELAASDELPVYANDLVLERGDRVYVLDPRRVNAGNGGSIDFVRISLRMTDGVRFVQEIAAEPVAVSELIRQVAERFGSGLERAGAFVASLRTASILLSALRPSPVDSPAEALIAQLANHPHGESLSALHRACATVDAIPLGDRNGAQYEQVASRFADLAAYDRFPLHVDMRCTFAGTLGADIVDEVVKLAEYTLRSSPPFARLSKFRERFMEVYEGTTRLVPLLELCDAGFGLGPPERAEQAPPDKERAGVLSAIAAEAINSGAIEIELNDDVIERLLPPLEQVRIERDFELGFEIAAASLEALRDGKYLVALANMAGSTAPSRTLGRFAHLFAPDVVARISDSVQSGGADSVEAELIYPPAKESVASLATRPRLLRYELQLGVRLSGDGFTRLDPAKLYVGLRDGRFYLWSTQIEAEVRVRESHVFHTYGQAPGLAMFLSALSAQDAASPAAFNWNEASWLPFLPRLRKGRIVLSPARWRIDLNELRAAPDRRAWLDAFRCKWRMPEYVFLQELDNRLPIRLEHPIAADLLLAASGQAQNAILQEFFHDPRATWLDSEHGSHAAEFVANVSVRRKTHPVPHPAPTNVMVALVHTPRKAWTYLRVPCGPSEQDRVVRRFGDRAKLLQLDGITDEWFFVRYGDARSHLRIRFKATTAEHKGAQDEALLALAEQLVEEGSIPEYSIHTYIPEVQRYGGYSAMSVVERLFSIDSAVVAAHLERLDDDDARLSRSVKTAYPLLQPFLDGFSGEDLDRCLAAERVALASHLREFVKSIRVELLDRETPYPPQLHVLAAELVCLQQRDGLCTPLPAIISSLLHMHFNRFGVDGAEGVARQMLRALHQTMAHIHREGEKKRA